MRKALLLILPLLFLGTGCISESWNGFYYPEGCLTCEDAYIFSPTFDNFNDCYAWARNIALEQNLGSDLFECGRACKFDVTHGSVCKETKDDYLPTSASAIEEERLAKEERRVSEENEYKKHLAETLSDYKKQSEELNEWETDLLNSIENNSTLVCSSILATADGNTNNSHSYWWIIRVIDELEDTFGSYKAEIEYIDKNLDAHRGIIRYFAEKCASVGYNVPVYQAD